MSLPFVTRARLDRLADRYLRDLNRAPAVSGDLRRRVASLERENAELRRQLEERSGVPMRRWPEW